MTRIRLADEADIPTIVAMGRDMFAMSSFAPLTYAPEKVAAFLRAGMDTGLLMVAEEEGEIAGFMHGFVATPWYSTDRMGCESFLYVRPQSRGTRAALMMLRAWVRWCQEAGAVQLRPGTAASSPEADRLYQALGFEPVGALYVMNRN
jgi:L-amino acid N-acyltransferase YncA